MYLAAQYLQYSQKWLYPRINTFKITAQETPTALQSSEEGEDLDHLGFGMTKICSHQQCRVGLRQKRPLRTAQVATLDDDHCSHG